MWGFKYERLGVWERRDDCLSSDHQVNMLSNFNCILWQDKIVIWVLKIWILHFKSWLWHSSEIFKKHTAQYSVQTRQRDITKLLRDKLRARACIHLLRIPRQSAHFITPAPHTRPDYLCCANISSFLTQILVQKYPSFCQFSRESPWDARALAN